MHPTIIERRSEISAICRRFGVKKLDVFGSAARGIDYEPGRSDVDFLVEYGGSKKLAPLEEYFGLRESLERLFGGPVDLVEPDAIKNPYLIASINAERETVYAA